MSSSLFLSHSCCSSGSIPTSWVWLKNTSGSAHRKRCELPREIRLPFTLAGYVLGSVSNALSITTSIPLPAGVVGVDRKVYSYCSNRQRGNELFLSATGIFRTFSEDTQQCTRPACLGGLASFPAAWERGYWVIY